MFAKGRRKTWILRATLFLVLTFSAGSAGWADTVVPSDRVTNRVNVRAEPSREGAIIGKLSPGDVAEMIQAVPYYYRIRLSNGTEGYVSRAWTERIPVDEGTAPTVASELLSATGNLEIHFIDVGQGDASLVLCPNGRTLLIDAGSLGGGIEPEDVRPYIISRLGAGQPKLDYLVVTHPDADHYNLLEDVLEGVSISFAYYVGNKIEYESDTIFEWIRDTPSEAKRLSATYFNEPDAPNEEIDCGDARVWVLAAAIDDNDEKNAKSIVLMIKFGDFEAIMTGDATFATEEAIMSRYDQDWLEADLLKIGHHGSERTSTSEDWVGVIKPKIAIASAAYKNKHGHPRRVVIDRAKEHTVQVGAHPVRWVTKGPNGPKDYRFYTRHNETEGVYTTSTSHNIKVVSDGSGYGVFLNQQ